MVFEYEPPFHDQRELQVRYLEWVQVRRKSYSKINYLFTIVKDSTFHVYVTEVGETTLRNFSKLIDR